MEKRLHLSLILGLLLSALLALTGFDVHCDAIRTHVLRLHILANSDSAEDQATKLAVRDRILSECGDLFTEVNGFDAAVAQARVNLPALEAAARKELDARGIDQPVSVALAPVSFETRTYDDVTLPAGEYTALQVTIGEGKGHNWWCVCYPNLCIPAASQTKEVTRALEDKDADVVTHSGRYEIRFRIVEWYQQLREWFTHRKSRQGCALPAFLWE